MKPIFTVLAVAGLVIAAESSNSTVTSTPSAKIPSSASPTCSAFLNSFNSAPDIQSCIKPVLDALASNSTSSLPSVCSVITSQGCSTAIFRSWLTQFMGNCSSEVNSNNQDVINLYSVLYIIVPFSGAVCSKDESGNYCLSKLAGNSSSKAASSLQNVAQQPLTDSDGSLDSKAFSDANIPWLGASSAMAPDELCTPCTKNILINFITWESSTPPAVGLENTGFLARQSDLWGAVQKMCPADFISTTLANAGASPGAANGAPSLSPAKGAGLLLALVAAGLAAL